MTIPEKPDDRDQFPPGFFGIRISDKLNLVLIRVWWTVFLFLLFLIAFFSLLEARR